ncbi:hypothetical protein C1H46_026889 [Malus baccata]|uniref:Uncharacterized protein n=1 Tax=Malus baccata TaxID=106549 RepID=A0A540LM86_MALBA|nr:hypothetical protein C1H46_026889 [Malus baccata]
MHEGRHNKLVNLPAPPVSATFSKTRLTEGKQEENTNGGDDGESLLCGGNRRSMCSIQPSLRAGVNTKNQ